MADSHLLDILSREQQQMLYNLLTGGDVPPASNDELLANSGLFDPSDLSQFDVSGLLENSNPGLAVQPEFVVNSSSSASDLATVAPVAVSVSSSEEASELHEKRAHPDDGDDEDYTAAAKRRESDKAPKKPGRKPITTEPATKRKAQNRAAQRAFRERKEKHVKDLEDKVEELEKSFQDTNSENAQLRSEITKLSAQLTEYKRRLLLAANARSLYQSTSPSLVGPVQAAAPGPNTAQPFQFEFPKFGSAPLTNSHGNANTSTSTSSPTTTASPPSASQKTTNFSPFSPSSLATSTSPNSNASPPSATNAIGKSFSTSSPVDFKRFGQAPAKGTQNTTVNNVNGFHQPSPPPYSSVGASSRTAPSPSDFALFSSLFTPESMTQSPGSVTGDSGSNSSSGKQRGSHDSSNNSNKNNSTSSSNGLTSTSQSPPALVNSNSTPGANSSCSASPESSSQSPGAYQSLDTVAALGDKSSSTMENLPLDLGMDGSLDWLVKQNGGQFDPQLFSGYRDPQDLLGTNFNLDKNFMDDVWDIDFLEPFNTAPSNLASLNGQQQQQQQLMQPQQQQQPLNTNVTPHQDLMTKIDATLQEGDSGPLLNAVTLQQHEEQQQKLLEAEKSKAREDEWPKHVPPGILGKKNGQRGPLDCPSLWESIRKSEQVQVGDFDLDSLCSDLQRKAHCSGNGLVIQESDFQDVLDKYLNRKSGAGVKS